MTTKKPELSATKPKYEPTEVERSALRKFDSRRAAHVAPRLKVQNIGKKTEISVHHPDQAIGLATLMEALGTADYDFVDGLLQQLAATALKGDEVDEKNINFLLSVVKDAKPKDHLEAMLLAQMAVVHVITLVFARRLPTVETLQEQDSTERALNKLARTFTTQLETLKRYRTDVEPPVTVQQNVSVNDGGQAIVGNVTQAAPVKAASPLALADARMTPMPMVGDQKDAAVMPQDRQKDDEQSST